MSSAISILLKLTHRRFFREKNTKYKNINKIIIMTWGKKRLPITLHWNMYKKS